MLDLKPLRYFVAVAEEGHLTNAAARLGISQPPLSQQIRALEAQLGVALFERLPRGMALTDSGRALLDDARAIIARMEQAVDGVRRVSLGQEGRLAVGFTGSAAFHPFVPSVIRAFRDEAPAVQLNLDESSTAELLDAVREGRLDLAFVRGPYGTTPDLTVERLLEEPMMVAFPSAHPAVRRKRRRIGLRDLADEPIILYRRHSGPGLYDAIVAACLAAGFSPRVVQEAPRMLSTLGLVAAGLGVSVVPQSLLRINLEGVVYVPLSGADGPRAPLSLAYRPGVHTGAAQRLIAQARDAAARL